MVIQNFNSLVVHFFDHFAHCKLVFVEKLLLTELLFEGPDFGCKLFVFAAFFEHHFADRTECFGGQVQMLQ